ncbi:hypothetical protein HDV02_005715 [Globomyces sp. JEL0801]|nr:hypothetical protein HDV02_005715 [Globomyces sp. JEL0801]
MQQNGIIAGIEKATFWDETISMTLTKPECYNISPPFHTCLSYSGKRLDVFEYIGDGDIAIDFKKLISSNTSLEIHVTVGMAFDVKEELLLELGFIKNPFHHTQVIRVLDISTVLNSNQKVFEGYEIRLMPDDEKSFEQRIKVESDIFGYPINGNYLDRLRYALKDMIKKGDLNYLCYSSEGQVVGYLTLRLHYNIPVIQGSGVLEGHRRKGLNRAMLSCAINKCKELGYLYAGTVAWDDVAAKTWESLGFLPAFQCSEWTRKPTPSLESDPSNK